MPERIVYMCDPDKNVQCPKDCCAYKGRHGLCRKTTQRDCAITIHGEPVVADDDWMKTAKKVIEEGDWDKWKQELEDAMTHHREKKGDCNGDYCEL